MTFGLQSSFVLAAFVGLVVMCRCRAWLAVLVLSVVAVVALTGHLSGLQSWSGWPSWVLGLVAVALALASYRRIAAASLKEDRVKVALGAILFAAPFLTMVILTST